VIVVTDWTRKQAPEEVGCKVLYIRTLSDGMTVDFE
jgi:hypothetical protein